MLAQREADLKGARMIAALDEIDADWENVRAAWLYGVARDDVARLQAAVYSLRLFGELRKTPHEIFGLWDPAVQALERAARTPAHDVLLGSLLLYQEPWDRTVDEMRERLRRAVRLLRQHNASGPLARALTNFGFVLARDRVHDEGDTYLREAVALARASGAPFELARALARRGNALVQFLPEKRDEAKRCLLEAHEIARTLGNLSLLNTARWGLGVLAFHRGDWAEVMRIYEDIARGDRAMRNKLGVAGTTMRLGWYVYLQGDIQRAVDLLEDSLAQHLDFTGDGRQPLARLSFVYQAAGDYAAARDAIVRTLQAFWIELRHSGFVLATLVAAGFLRAAEGQPEAAVELLARALTDPACHEEFHELSEPVLADLQAQLPPDVYAAAWARGEALDLDTTVRTLIDELSATPDAADAVGMPHAVDTSPDALSERELEVLALLAEGLTNRQIAEALFISLGTVKAHAHNIYEKLGVNNRTQAVARAREKGLL